MRGKPLAAGLAICAALMLVGSATAGDTIRLNMTGNVDAPTFDLKVRPADLDFQADPTWGWRGGWRGGWGGGWRGGWGGGWRGGWGWGGGWRGGWGWGGPRFVGGWYAPSFYSYPVYNYGFAPTYSYWGGFYPCDSAVTVTTTRPAVPSMPRIIESAPVTPPNGNGNGNGAARPAPNGNGNGAARPAPNGSYDYDGGPKNPVPMPKKANEMDVRFPSKPALVPNEVFVGLEAAPQKSGKWVYPAYGEAPKRGR